MKNKYKKLVLKYIYDMYSNYDPNETPIPITIMRPPPPIKVEKPASDKVVVPSLEYNPIEIPIYNEYSVLPDVIKIDKALNGEHPTETTKTGIHEILPPTIRISREDDEDEGICEYVITPANSIQLGHYLIEKICSAKGGCGHYFQNIQTGNVYWKSGHAIHKILKRDGYSHPHFDKYENWEEEQKKMTEQQYAELEARREKERLEIEKAIAYQPRTNETRNWKR